MSDVGLVLAAGAATRFGSPKQLAEFRGAPMISWPIRALWAGGLERVIVVLGAQADRIASQITDAGTETVVADNWAEGMSASLRRGVTRAAEFEAERVIIALADQPLLHPDAVARVRQAARDTGAAIVRASYDGAPGHPVALSAATFDAVAELRGDAGARRLTGFQTLDVSCDSLGSPVDIDTREDLAGAE